MKSIIFALTLSIAFLSSGCATWEAVKKDTKDAYDSTKEAIHDATE